MKDNRRVILKTERFRKIRFNLRRIIIDSVYDEIEILRNYLKLYRAILESTPKEQKEVFFLQGTKQELIRALNRSICVCSICTKDDRDMVYIKSHNEWYCTKCQDKNYIWNSSMVSEEERPQPNYTSFYKHGGKLPKKSFRKDKG